MTATQTNLEGHGELFGQRNGNTAGVEELRILAVELGIGVQEEEVGCLNLEAEACKMQFFNYALGEVIGKGELLEADEVTAGYAGGREVVCVVCITQILTGIAVGAVSPYGLRCQMNR